MKGVFAVVWLALLLWIATSHGNPIGDGMQHLLSILTTASHPA